MTPFEKLYALATGPGPVVEKAREMVGEDKLAVMLAETALAETGKPLSASRVGKVLKKPRKTVAHQIGKIDFAKVVK